MASVRLVPDVVRLVRRLAADRSLPRGVRVRLWVLLGYLVSPVDLVPDFIPLVGYADDAIIVALVLRSVIRRRRARRHRDPLARNDRRARHAHLAVPSRQHRRVTNAPIARSARVGRDLTRLGIGTRDCAASTTFLYAEAMQGRMFG